MFLREGIIEYKRLPKNMKSSAATCMRSEIAFRLVSKDQAETPQA